MLKIFNDLTPFFEDNYIRINIREYAKLQNISPPTASTLLASLHSENLLKQNKEKLFIHYYANKEETLFIDLARIYWKQKLVQSGLIQHIRSAYSPLIILYGSLAQGQATKESDIDLAIFSKAKPSEDLEIYEKKLKRAIHIMHFTDRKEVKNQHLLNNILDGKIIEGHW